MMEVEAIHVDSKIVKIKYDANSKLLTVTTELDPEIIDNNFNELDERLKKMEIIVNELNKLFNVKLN